VSASRCCTLGRAWSPPTTSAPGTAPHLRSTSGRTLAEEGFIHLSLARQVRGVASSFYQGRDVVLLALNPHLLIARVAFEHAPDVDDDFPHLYGPIPRAAIVSARAVPRGRDGAHDFSGLLPEPV